MFTKTERGWGICEANDVISPKKPPIPSGMFPPIKLICFIAGARGYEDTRNWIADYESCYVRGRGVGRKSCYSGVRPGHGLVVVPSVLKRELQYDRKEQGGSCVEGIDPHDIGYITESSTVAGGARFRNLH